MNSGGGAWDMPEHRATPEDHAYFHHVAAANARLDDHRPPASLDEMFERLERMERCLGGLGRAGVTGSDDGDLASHLAYIERLRSIDPAYRAQ